MTRMTGDNNDDDMTYRPSPSARPASDLLQDAYAQLPRISLSREDWNLEKAGGEGKEICCFFFALSLVFVFFPVKFFPRGGDFAKA